MSKILQVARTEYLNSVRSKAFIIGVIMLPVMMFGGIALQFAVKDKVDVRDRKFAVVDHTGRLFATIEEQARQRNENDLFTQPMTGDRRQTKPAFVPVLLEPSRDAEERPDIALSDKVRSGELFAFITLDKNIVDPKATEETSIHYYTETPTFMELPNWLEQVINNEIQKLRFENSGIDQEIVASLSSRRSVRKMGLVSVQDDKVIEAERENPAATFGIPFVSMFLLFAILMTSAPALLNTVLEEKLQKIAEVLLAAATPFQLMLGKLLGSVGVSLTLATLYVGGAYFSLRYFGFHNLVPGTHYLWFLLFLILALLIFGSLFSAIGAACSEIKDAQTMMFPAMILIMIPLFVWMPVLQSPDSPFSRLLSLIPPLTPMIMMLRVSIPPGPPWWELFLGIGLTVLFMLACVWASGKIFRIGILSHGQTPSFAKLVQWLWSR